MLPLTPTPILAHSRSPSPSPSPYLHSESKGRKSVRHDTDAATDADDRGDARLSLLDMHREVYWQMKSCRQLWAGAAEAVTTAARNLSVCVFSAIFICIASTLSIRHAHASQSPGCSSVRLMRPGTAKVENCKRKAN